MTEALTIDRSTLPALAKPEPMMVTPIDPKTAFMPVPWALIEEAAMMIASAPGLAPQFNEAANCRFIAYQAARWGADPIAVASKTYFSPRKGGGLVVGYEAQLVHALIEADPDLVEPLDFVYGYSNPDRPIAAFRYCKVVGLLRTSTGRIVRRTLTTPTVSQVKVKNSPLWYSDPDQQLSYYGSRAWGRRYRPARLMGVYTREEMAEAGFGHNSGDTLPHFEEDEGFNGIQATDEDAKNFDRWEQKTGGSDGDDTKTFDRTKGGGGRSAPPNGEGNEPPDLGEVRAWAEEQRKRIVALTDHAAVSVEWTKLVESSSFKRLVAYDQPLATTIKRAIQRRVDDLKGAE